MSLPIQLTCAQKQASHKFLFADKLGHKDVRGVLMVSRCYWATMRRKLGLLQVDNAEEDQALVTDLLQVMHDTGADFTNTFRRLATFPTPPSQGDPLGTPQALCHPVVYSTFEVCKS